MNIIHKTSQRKKKRKCRKEEKQNLNQKQYKKQPF